MTIVSLNGSPRRRAIVRWILCLATFLFTAGFRFLSLDNGFPNDHFVYISGGWQTLVGEWPTRDWIDQGLPLQFASSAFAQAILGQTLLAEAVLVSVAFGLAAAVTLAVVLASTGSVAIGIGAALLEVAVLPRTYGYPKVLVYSVAFLCFHRYLVRPGTGRLFAMAAAIAVAFLFRHDHGLFLTAGGVFVALLAPDSSGMAQAVRRAGLLLAAIGALLLPYLIYVEVYSGIVEYLRVGIAVSRREAARQWHEWPAVFGDDRPLLSAFLYQLHAIPIVALTVLLAYRRDRRFRTFMSWVVPVSLVAVAVNVSFLRAPLPTRLADGIAPAVVLGGWVVHRAWHARRRLVAVPAVLAIVALFTASVLEVGDTAEAIDRIGPPARWWHPGELFSERTMQLRERFFEQQLPSRATVTLLPFFSYVDRCTAADDRLLVGGFLVEVPFFAKRRFAAGMGYLGGSFGTEIDERAAERLRRQVVPLFVIRSEEFESFNEGFPQVAAYVESRFEPLATLGADEVRILVNRELASRAGRDQETGWPCFVTPVPAAVQ